MTFLPLTCGAVKTSIRGPSRLQTIDDHGHSQNVDAQPQEENTGPHRRELIPKSSRIIGGHVAAPNQYQYTVSLQSNGIHFCGGVLIAIDVS